MNQHWYYTYDQETKTYLGAILSENIPQNATTIEPLGIIDTPVFDEDTGKWKGMTLAEYSNSANGLPTEKTAEELISGLTQQLAFAQINQAKTNAILMQQNATLVKQITTLQSEKETSNG